MCTLSGLQPVVVSMCSVVLAASAFGGPPGTVDWRLQIDDAANLQYITLGADGTIYTSDSIQVYAVSPDGEIIWTSAAAWGGRPISIGPDGTIYTGTGHAQSAQRTIVALHPDGATKWVFTPKPEGSLLSGPGVGPDGNIYAVQEHFDFGGLGAFSLDPDGDLRWSHQGDPGIHSDPGDNGPIVFNGDRLHFAIVTDAGTSAVLSTFDLDGHQLWTSWAYHPTSGTGYPRVDPFGRVIGRWGQTGMRAFTIDGAEDWVEIHPAGGNFLLRPTVASSGVIYAGDYIGVKLWAINPDGSTRWFFPSTGELLESIAVAPDDSILVATGSDGFGQPPWVRGYDTADGSLLWQYDFEPGDGAFLTSREPVFSADSSTAYLTTQFAGAVDVGNLIAISVADTPTTGDIDGDGDVDFVDLLSLLAAWGDCPDPPAGCPADLDGNGTVDFSDLLMLLANWG